MVRELGPAAAWFNAPLASGIVWSFSRAHPSLSLGPPTMQKSPADAGAAIALRYASPEAARTLLAEPAGILGVVGFGAPASDALPAPCPFIAAPLSPIGSEAMLEIWSTNAPCTPVTLGAVWGACSPALAFGAITLDEAGPGSLETVVEAAYLNIFDFLDQTGFAAPIRFWNYVRDITRHDGGIERYRRFNIGRHRAFAARLRQDLPPAASGVGAHHGHSVIYFLAAHQPAQTVENPRQMSAYAYPPLYGPRSPSFSRAGLHRLGARSTLFVSGTASITGHETRHPGDLRGQIAETIENLRVLGAAAEHAASLPLGDHQAFKIYLHESAYRDQVDQAITEAFGADCPRLYLHGAICRSELLVEIEAVRQHDPGMRLF